MSEKTSYNWLKASVFCVRNDRLDRIENIVVTGMPDVNGCVGGNEFWIECKHPKEPKRAATPLFGSNHKLTQEQANWLLRQSNAGGKAFVFIDTDSFRALMRGVIGMRLNTMTRDEIKAEALCWHTKPARASDCLKLRLKIVT